MTGTVDQSVGLCKGSRAGVTREGVGSVGVGNRRVGEGEGSHGWPDRPIEIEVSSPIDILESIGWRVDKASGEERGWIV